MDQVAVLQEHLIVLQVQIVVMGVVGAAPRPNIGSNIEVARPQTFNGKTRKVWGFLTACRLYIQMKMREVSVKK